MNNARLLMRETHGRLLQAIAAAWALHLLTPSPAFSAGAPDIDVSSASLAFEQKLPAETAGMATIASARPTPGGEDPARRATIKELLRVERNTIKGAQIASGDRLRKIDPSRPMGLRPMTDAEIESYVGELILSAPGAQLADGRPRSVDHSIHSAFPQIAHQGYIGSCSSFAAVHYLKTFQEAKEHDWTPKTGGDATIMSPAFIYSLTNDGQDWGSHPGAVMDEICQKGAPTRATMPYDYRDYTSWGSAAAWKEAVQYRGQTSGVINQHSAAGIELVKDWLSAGECAVVCTEVHENWYLWYGKAPDNNNGNGHGGVDNFVVFENRGQWYGAHAMALVGYDDDREYRDAAGKVHKGAFKVANSWGLMWGDSGFFWLSYDFVRQTDLLHAGMWYVYTLTDRVGYSTETLAYVELEHAARTNLTVEVARTAVDASPWSASYLRKQGGEHAMPSNGLWFDVKDAYVPGAENEFVVRVTDVAGDPVEGVVKSFGIELGGTLTVSEDVPKKTENGQTIELSVMPSLEQDNIKTFTVSNSGAGTLRVTSVSIAGGSGWLSVAPTGPFNISAGGRAHVRVNLDWDRIDAPTVTETIRVQSNDPDEGAVNVTVTAKPLGNQPPAFEKKTPASAEVFVQAGSRLQLSAQARDPDANDTLTYEWLLDDSASQQLQEGSDGAAEFAATADMIGSHVIMVTVDDGNQNTIEHSWSVRVGTTDDPELVGYWSMDDAKYQDQTGRGHDLSIKGRVERDWDGVVNGSLEFRAEK